MNNLIVLGAQWGDEGKGKLVDLLSDRFDVVVRYQGGHNAGHTIIVGERKFVLKLIPSGILHPGKMAVIGNGLVVDPIALVSEIDALEAAGVNVSGQLRISNRAHVLLPFHRMMERLSEARPGRISIGTTSRGIGPCYEDKMGRRGIRFGDFVRFRCFEEAYDGLRAEKVEILKAFDLFDGLDDGKERERYREIAERLRPLVCDTAGLLNQEIRAGRRVLFEGAQGTMLDVDHGTYPFVTSSNCVAGQAAAGAGVGPGQLHYVLGVAKAYATRVGAGPFPTELEDEVGEHLRVKGNEYGSVTGRPRRCGWFDAAALKRAVQLNGIGGLCITKLDVLDGLDKVRVAVGYKVAGGERREILPVGAEALAICEPIYEEHAGWKESTVGVKRYADLPANARAYLERLQELVAAPISIISTGPDREETIVLRHPFE